LVTSCNDCDFFSHVDVGMTARHLLSET
jgi:hypothetical protein